MTLHCFGTQLRRNINPAFFKFIKNRCVPYSTTSNIREKWDLVSAVCLERKPITTTELNAMEKKFSQLLNDIELENSLQSDHEQRHKQDIIQADLLKRGEETDVEQTLKQTAQDFEDACQEEFNKFQFSPRRTEADEKNDTRSLNRKLDRSLLLLVEHTYSGGGKVWSLPQGVRCEGETMRQAAERSLRDTCGAGIRAKFLGNAPCGFYKYKYPKTMRDMTEAPVGAKVFFFKALHVEGQVETNDNKVKDYRWLGREELGPVLHKDYYNSISQFLIEQQ